MSKSILALLIVLTGVTAPAGQSPPSIQGVWRNVEGVIPASTNPGDRIDPFGHVPIGTQTNVQPGLLIFTKQHYSRTTDTAVQPRPRDGYVNPAKRRWRSCRRGGGRSRRMPAPMSCQAIR